MLNRVKNTYCRYISFEERVLHVLMLSILLVGLTGIVLNRFIFEYPGTLYTLPVWLRYATFFLLLLIFSIYVEDKTRGRLVFFTRMYTTYYLILVILSVAITGIQYTPFPPVDSVLLKWDRWFGFDMPGVLEWTAGHPELKRLFHFAYYGLEIELFVVAFVLVFSKDRWPIYEFFIISLSAFLIAILIYYVFPTATPTAVVNSPYFTAVQYQAATEFREIHQYLPITEHNGGIIAFPSCHVIWAVLLTYSLRSKAWMLYPMGAFNLMAMLATLLLGWHYLLDVLAALVIVAVCILFACWVRRRSVGVFLPRRAQ